jgi:hypothetical protein
MFVHIKEDHYKDTKSFLEWPGEKGEEEAVHYSRIFAFCGGRGWNLTPGKRED